MIKNKSLGWSLLLALALVVFLAAGGNAAETKQAPKASKPSKSVSKETPPQSRWGSSRRPSRF